MRAVGHEYLGARDGVIWNVVLVDVKLEPRRVEIYISRDGGEMLLGDFESTVDVAVEEDLCAAQVVLRVVSMNGPVQSQNFGAHEVVSRRQPLGEVYGQQTVVLDERINAPLLRLRAVAVFPDLEPPVTRGAVCQHVVDSLEIDGTWALVARIDTAWLLSIRPEAKLKSEQGPLLCRTDKRNRLSAIAACRSDISIWTLDARGEGEAWLTAGHVFRDDRLDWEGCRLPIVRHTNTSAVSLALAIDVEGSKGSMGICQSGKAQH